MAYLGTAVSSLSAASGLTTTQLVALGLTAASGVFNARAQASAAKAEAKMSEENARYQDLRAADAIAQGTQQADRIRLQLRKVLGSQRAIYGAGNVDLSLGTPIDVALDSAREAELDTLIARNNAAREALGYKLEGRQSRFSGRLSRGRAKTDPWGTVLTTGAKAFGIYAEGI